MDKDEMTDEEIIDLYNEGDKNAFKSLIHRYSSPLYNFAARTTGKSNAPDIVQEVFIKVWKHIGNFNQKKASFKTWIFTIARNTTTDFLRKKKDILFQDVASGYDEDADSIYEKIPDEHLLPDAALQKMQDKELLDAILDRLAPASREILVLHYQEEMTFDEIGKILGKPLNTVKSSHRRAILELRKMLD